jgi:hypothetical protein
MDQVVQLIGAVLILAAFTATQAGKLSPHALSYLVLNFAGAAILTVVALVGSNWGFLLLEAVWTLVSAWGLLQLARGRQPTAAH